MVYDFVVNVLESAERYDLPFLQTDPSGKMSDTCPDFPGTNKVLRALPFGNCQLLDGVNPPHASELLHFMERFTDEMKVLSGFYSPTHHRLLSPQSFQSFQ